MGYIFYITTLLYQTQLANQITGFKAFGLHKQTHAIFNGAHLFMTRHADRQRHDLNNKIYSFSVSVSHLETIAG